MSTGAHAPDRAPDGARVAAVIVTHDTRDEALACVDSLRSAAADEIVVVDSGSSDGTVEALRDAHPDITVVALDNVGYGRGANAGVTYTSAPYLLVANADTRYPEDGLQELADVLAVDPALGAAGPMVCYPDGRHQASARTFPTLGQAAGHALFGLWWPDNPWTRRYRQRDARADEPREVDWLSGCALMLRRTAFVEVGGFDPGYFMFVEDVDLGYRLRQAGWKVRYSPEVAVTHTVGVSTRHRRAEMVIAHAKSLDRFYARAYGHGVGRFLRPLVRLGLAGWVGLVLAWGAIVGVRSGRSSTGE